MTRAPTRLHAALLICALMGTAVAGAWQDFGLVRLAFLSDEGYCLQVATRLLEGQMPYRDYIAIWSPGTTLLTAASLQVFGRTLWAGRLPMALFIAASFPLLYRWLRQHYDRGPSLAGVCAAWSLSPLLLSVPYATVFTLAPAVLAFQQLGRLRPGRIIGPAWWAGVACGLTIALKHNIGILVGLAVWVRLLCVTPYTVLAPRPRTPPTTSGLLLRIPAVLLALFGVAYLWMQFPGSHAAGLLLLGPGVLLVAVGTRHAAHLDGAATHGWSVGTLAVACGAVAAGVTVVTLPWVLWLVQANALRPFLEYSLILRTADNSQWGALYGQLLRIPPPSATTLLAALGWGCGLAALQTRSRATGWAWASAAGALVVAALLREGLYSGQRILPYTAAALFAGAAVWHRADTPARVRYAGMWTVCSVYLMLAYPSATLIHLTTGLAPAVAAGMALAWTRARETGLPARAATFTVLVSICALGWGEWLRAFRVPDETGARWTLPQRIPGPHGGTWTRGDYAEAFPALAARLDTVAPAGTPVVAWPALGIFNFYTGRPNPTRMDLYWPGFVTPAMEQTLLDELTGAAPAAAVFCTAPDLVFGDGLLWSQHPRLAAYFAQHYYSVGQLGVWEIHARLPASAQR